MRPSVQTRTGSRLHELRPLDLDLQLALDIYATCKTLRSTSGRRATRFHPHFTPTSSSWLNHVGRWFADQDIRNYFRFLTCRHAPSRVGCLSVIKDVGCVIVESTIEKLQTWLSRGD